MRIIKYIIQILILIVFTTSIFSEFVFGVNNNTQSELNEILKKCAEYCQKLENSSLYYICAEEIKERIFYSSRPMMGILRHTRFFKENTYIYDYQLIRKDKKINERRILIKENGKKKNVKNAQLKTKRFYHKHVIFGPVGLLGGEQQRNFDYKILKEVSFKGEKAIILEAIPKFPNKLETLYGRIWTRKKDFSVLKIEWNQESMRNFKEIEKIAKSLNAKPHITFISEYGFEKNKIRFPNKYSVKEAYLHLTKGTFVRSLTTVTYSSYKFFTVETDVIYK